MFPLTNGALAVVKQRAMEFLGKTEQEVDELALTGGARVSENFELCYLDSVPFLRRALADQQLRLHLPYKVYIDGVQVTSCTRLFEAAWTCDKLCQSLITAREVRVTDGEKIVTRWISVGNGMWRGYNK